MTSCPFNGLRGGLKMKTRPFSTVAVAASASTNACGSLSSRAELEGRESRVAKMESRTKYPSQGPLEYSSMLHS
jgi:hypothetical protein